MALRHAVDPQQRLRHGRNVRLARDQGARGYGQLFEQFGKRTVLRGARQQCRPFRRGQRCRAQQEGAFEWRRGESEQACARCAPMHRRCRCGRSGCCREQRRQPLPQCRHATIIVRDLGAVPVALSGQRRFKSPQVSDRAVQLVAPVADLLWKHTELEHRHRLALVEHQYAKLAVALAPMPDQIATARIAAVEIGLHHRWQLRVSRRCGGGCQRRLACFDRAQRCGELGAGAFAVTAQRFHHAVAAQCGVDGCPARVVLMH